MIIKHKRAIATTTLSVAGVLATPNIAMGESFNNSFFEKFNGLGTLPVDPGSFPGAMVQMGLGIIMQMFWGIYYIIWSLISMLMTQVLTFEWFGAVAIPFNYFASHLQGILGRIHWIPLALSAAALVAFWHFAKGRTASAWRDVLLSATLASLAVTIFANPVGTLSGPNGALTTSARFGAEFSNALIGGNPQNNQSTNDLIDSSLKGSITETFLETPAQLILFGTSLKGTSAGGAWDENMAKIAEDPSDKNIKKLREDVIKSAKSGGGAAAGLNGKQVEAWSKNTPLQLGSMFLYFPALFAFLVLSIGVTGIVIYAALSALWQCLALMFQALLAIAPGTGRAGLWKRLASMGVSIALVGASIVFLVAYLKFIQLLLGNGDPNSPAPTLLKMWGPLTYPFISLVLIIGMIIFWRMKKGMQSGALSLASALSTSTGSSVVNTNTTSKMGERAKQITTDGAKHIARNKIGSALVKSGNPAAMAVGGLIGATGIARATNPAQTTLGNTDAPAQKKSPSLGLVTASNPSTPMSTGQAVSKEAPAVAPVGLVTSEGKSNSENDSARLREIRERLGKQDPQQVSGAVKPENTGTSAVESQSEKPVKSNPRLEELKKNLTPLTPPNSPKQDASPSPANLVAAGVQKQQSKESAPVRINKNEALAKESKLPLKQKSPQAKNTVTNTEKNEEQASSKQRQKTQPLANKILQQNRLNTSGSSTKAQKIEPVKSPQQPELNKQQVKNVPERPIKQGVSKVINGTKQTGVNSPQTTEAATAPHLKQTKRNAIPQNTDALKTQAHKVANKATKQKGVAEALSKKQIVDSVEMKRK